MKRQSKNPVYPENTLTNASPIFAEALREDSNLEIDWLWTAEQVSSLAERIYCLMRALYTNPKRRKTFDLLKALEAQQAMKQMTASIPHQQLDTCGEDLLKAF